MKEKTFYTCIAIGFVIIIIVLTSLIHQVTLPIDNNTHYVTQAKVIGIDTASDTVQIEDSHGKVWEFFGAENFQKGNSVIVLMDDQSTSTVYDDTILSVRLDPFAN